MIENGISIVEQFTRPLLTISRNLGSEEVIQESATFFFINELGYAITTADILEKYFPQPTYIEKYQIFKSFSLSPNCDIEKLKSDFGYTDHNQIIDLKILFLNCGADITNVVTILHPNYNLGILYFENALNLTYNGYAKFLSNTENIKKGKELLRIGYPFPFSKNYSYDIKRDEIDWDFSEPFIIDHFPLKSITTRIHYQNNIPNVIEMESAGFPGHEGSPLFDENGIIYGMHISNKKYENSNENKYPTAIFGNSISANIITDFLLEQGIKFYQIENGKEVVYNEKVVPLFQQSLPVQEGQFQPTAFISSEGESAANIYKMKMVVDNKVVVDYNQTIQIGVNKMDSNSKKEGFAFAQFSIDGQENIFITEENAGSVSYLNKGDTYKLKVLKKEVKTENWKVRTSVKNQLNSKFEYFDILVIRRGSQIRDHEKDPHIAFFPDASGKYIRYDNEKSIKIVTQKIISGIESHILPLSSKIEADEFAIEIKYELNEMVLSITDIIVTDK